MCSKPALQVQGLAKTFKLFQRSRDRIAEILCRAKKHRVFTALDNISFFLAKGETLGIIGENGSGKSTLLKLIAGILEPDAGTITRNGRIAGLLELGTGFNQQLSGRKNIYLNGVYLDLTKKELTEREQAIIDFAELDKFIDAPLKTYSSGMMMRLGFAIAVHADPQCFIIDEALSVGDVRFQQKCFERLEMFRKSGGSILFVSHDLNAVKRICDRAMLLDQGKIRFLGDPEEAANGFYELLAAKGASGATTATGYGNGDISFTSVRLLSENGKPARAFNSGSPMTVAFKWACHRPARQVTFGITIRDRFGQDIFGINGYRLKSVKDIHANGAGCFRIDALNLGPGAYSINLAAHTGDTHLQNCFHWWDSAAEFEVLEDPDYSFCGVAKLSVTLSLN
ncbi:MAG: ABC transporter ATP-binding protein [Desulfovibrio sp.]|nr:ABC transporter ATP-binding protein [Desulfovibrio sp.]